MIQKTRNLENTRKDFSVLESFNEIDWKLSGLVEVQGLTDFFESLNMGSKEAAQSAVMYMSSSPEYFLLSDFHKIFELFGNNSNSKNQILKRKVEERASFNKPPPSSSRGFNVQLDTPLTSQRSQLLSSRSRNNQNYQNSNSNDFLRREPKIDLLGLIATKEQERQNKIRQDKQLIILGQKPDSVPKRVPRFQDNRDIQKRKGRLTDPKIKDSVKLRQHHKKLSKRLKRELLMTLEKMGELEAELDEAKQDLVLCGDFYLSLLFNFFDVNRKQKISLFEIWNGLFDLNIFPNKEDLAVAINQYDEYASGYLDIQAFKKMVLPKEKTYRDTMKNRERKVPYKIFEEVNNPIQMVLSLLLGYF